MSTLNNPIDFDNPGDKEFLKNIQGNILKGHGRSHVSIIFLRFDINSIPGITDPNVYPGPGSQRIDLKLYQVRGWLSQLSDRITSAWQQHEDSRAFAAQGPSNQPFMNVLLSGLGYEALIVPEKTPTDVAFLQGMRKRIPDALPHDPEPGAWEAEYQIYYHAMILLAHENEHDLAKMLSEIQNEIETLGFVEFKHEERGKKLPSPHNAGKAIEHFGYEDGISQPLFAVQHFEAYKLANDIDRWNPIAPWNRVLVEDYENSGSYGSYLVFRKLEQALTQIGAVHPDDIAGAQAMGRQKDGTPLIEPSGQGRNNFSFRPPEGNACPVTAHIRIMNQRDGTSLPIARRGITYGERPDLSNEGGEVPSQGVGLLFMSFQSNIEDQFEVLQNWAEGDNVDGVIDAIIGHTAPNPRLVTLTGGEYFFAPSKVFLKSLSDLEGAIDERQRNRKQRFKDALTTLLTEDEILDNFGNLWVESRPIEAVDIVGISRDDFITLYSYVGTLDRELVLAGRVMLNNQGHTPANWDDVDTQKLSDAFEALLDLNTLRNFMELWPDTPEKALKEAHPELEPEEILSFYNYLSSKSVVLNFPIWF